MSVCGGYYSGIVVVQLNGTLRGLLDGKFRVFVRCTYDCVVFLWACDDISAVSQCLCCIWFLSLRDCCAVWSYVMPFLTLSMSKGLLRWKYHVCSFTHLILSSTVIVERLSMFTCNETNHVVRSFTSCCFCELCNLLLGLQVCPAPSLQDLEVNYIAPTSSKHDVK